MPLVPMKQSVTIGRDDGPLDRWGKATKRKTFTLPCRFDEGSFLVEEKSSGNVTSQTSVATGRIFFDKLADIRYTDDITYVNELNISVTRKPKKINVKRSNSGKPVLTEVYI